MKLLLILLLIAIMNTDSDGVECTSPHGKHFTNCSTHLSCSECVSSQLSCQWCVDGHQCTNDIGERSERSCRYGTVVNSVNSHTYQSGPASCPSAIQPTTENANEILVEYGAKKSIKVDIRNLLSGTADALFSCRFDIEGTVTRVNAELLLQGTVQCDPIEFVYTTKSPHYTATVAIFFGTDRNPMGSPQNVTIYRCRYMSDSCSTCLTLPAKYQCGWCKSSSTCEFRGQCAKVQYQSDWLDRGQNCGSSSPIINSFMPSTGPVEGGTNITIRGLNLGRRFSDIHSAVVEVAGINCEPYPELYVAATEIVCAVDRPYSQEYRRGRIVVQIAGSRGESVAEYEFLDPQIEDFTPKFGSVSGGTQITITGKHLNTGSRIEAFIDKQPCEIRSVDETQVLCRTGPVNYLKKGKLRMTLDSGTRVFSGGRYEYVKDPLIESVTSGPTTTRKSPKGIPAGGISVTVVGNHFETIQRSQMFVFFANKTFSKRFEQTGECTVLSNTTMNCVSPKINDTDILDQLNNVNNVGVPTYLDYGFKINDAFEVKNLSNKDDYRPFELYPNPVYLKWQEISKSFEEGESLVIEGFNLNQACTESDVVAMVGRKTCTITSLSQEQLICTPPSAAPDGNASPIVSVTVGKVLTYNIGELSYASLNKGVSVFVIVTGSLTLGLLLCVMLALIICYFCHADDRSTLDGTLSDVQYRARPPERGEEARSKSSRSTTGRNDPAASVPNHPRNHVYYELMKR